ncbi:protein terminal ear1-like [Lycium ferocissimum]|uniref:protein terminal ear1-like n=1 Tax=Lycium ferocissimum TaxID=112874 RepID=UPI00281509E3|nr:protein terminal ear1-like [Lycium ferocissimum]
MSVRRSLLNPQAPEYTPISHVSNTAFHPPSPPRENVTGGPRNIPTKLVKARESVSRPRTPPRLRKGKGRGFFNGNRGVFGRGSCSSNEGLVCRRMENDDQRRNVCYRNWSRNNGLKKHDVIPLSWSRKNNTTVMIKNIPYDYNREMLMQFLDEYCSVENQKATDSKGENIVSAYDFLYLPMDFKSKRGKGYAFVNFTDHRTVWKFFCAFNDKLNVFPGSYRRVKIVTAKFQGKEALVHRFKETRFECESEGFLPVWFSPSRDGSGESVQMITVGKCKATPSCSSLSR